MRVASSRAFSNHASDKLPNSKAVQTSPTTAKIDKAFHTDPKVVRDAIEFLAKTALAVSADVLSTHPVGKIVVVILKQILDRNNDSGAAARSCEQLKRQVELVAAVVARALDNKALESEVARIIREELCVALERAQRLIASWEGRGSLQQFLIGNAADEEFRAVHQELTQCYQHVALARVLLLSCPRPPPPVAYPEEEADILRPVPYRELAAAKEAYERLLLLFALVYKPSAADAGRQERRLLELLAVLNCDRRQRLLPMLNQDSKGRDVEVGGPAGQNGTEGKIEVIASRLGAVVDGWPDESERAALDVILQSVVASVWRRQEAMPISRIGKLRVAVFEALRPLQEATGILSLPQAPPAAAGEVAEAAAGAAACEKKWF